MTDRIRLSEEEEREAVLLANYLYSHIDRGFATARELVALRALLRECRRTRRRLPLSVQRVLDRFPTHSDSLRLRQAEADSRSNHDV